MIIEIEKTGKKISYSVVFKIMFTILSVFVYMISIYYRIFTPISLTVIILLNIVAIAPNRMINKLVASFYSLILMLLLNFDILQFNFIPQAKVLLDVNKDLIYWFSNGHPHAIRLFVAYPGYILSNLYNVSLDIGYTYYGIILFVILYLVMSNILMRLQIKINNWKSILAYNLMLIPLLILPLIMNGRLIPAFLGFSLLINLFINTNLGFKITKFKIVSIITFSFILTMVSSGTMTVAFIYILVMLYSSNYKKLKLKKTLRFLFFILILSFPIIFKVLDYVWLMLSRNIQFYGGGIKGVVNMLNHGAGRFITFDPIVLYTFIFLGFFFLLINIKYILNKIRHSDALSPVVIAINISAYGMLFGFSTGLMIIPPFLLWAIKKLI